jgi:hypothetical protein
MLCVDVKVSDEMRRDRGSEEVVEAGRVNKTLVGQCRATKSKKIVAVEEEKKTAKVGSPFPGYVVGQAAKQSRKSSGHKEIIRGAGDVPTVAYLLSRSKEEGGWKVREQDSWRKRGAVGAPIRGVWWGVAEG